MALKGARSCSLLLYDDPHSEFCAKVKVAMYHKQLKWETLQAGPCGKPVSPLFLQRAPLRKIPVLVVVPDHQQEGAPEPPAGPAAGAGGAPEAPSPGEVVLYESEVITEWLDEEFPHPPMLPQQPLARAQARLIARFHDLYLEPALRKLYPQVAPHDRDAAAVSAAGQEFLRHLSHLDSQLLLPGCRLAVGDSLSLADCGYPGLFLYAQLLFPVLGLGQLDFSALGLSRVAAWHAALCEEPAVLRVLEELKPAAQQWLDSKLSS